ncbi:hypothetical protein PIB30_106984 [Stylosanthes scabra]|uniref:AB hydrolase-1 domain-containing protein n=1 Tax=Stylosanthes scabra TaxID=79078 RepID=A0ABU6ZYI8_9FABA|nr:hypothetical protein [Stylosanthes scabra]
MPSRLHPNLLRSAAVVPLFGPLPNTITLATSLSVVAAASCARLHFRRSKTFQGEETEAWYIDSLEEWRKAKNLSNFVLLGHSFGGYVASKYAHKHPEHVKHLILVGPAGFSQEAERITKFLSRLERITIEPDMGI